MECVGLGVREFGSVWVWELADSRLMTTSYTP